MRARMARSARRSLVFATPPAWIHGGSMIRRRVLGHSGGIEVERDVQPFRARAVHQLEHPLRRTGVGGAVVEVGQAHGAVALAPDLDRLAEGIEEAVAERVADVRVVEA